MYLFQIKVDLKAPQLRKMALYIMCKTDFRTGDYKLLQEHTFLRCSHLPAQPHKRTKPAGPSGSAAHRSVRSAGRTSGAASIRPVSLPVPYTQVKQLLGSFYGCQLQKRAHSDNYTTCCCIAPYTYLQQLGNFEKKTKKAVELQSPP